CIDSLDIVSVSMYTKTHGTSSNTTIVELRPTEYSQRGIQTKSCKPRASRSVVSRSKKIPSSPGLRNENPVPPRPFCPAKISCEYQGSGSVQEICAPTPRNPSGPRKRPLTSGASAKSQACG